MGICVLSGMYIYIYMYNMTIYIYGNIFTYIFIPCWDIHCWDKLTDKSGISLVPVPKDKNVVFHHSSGRFYQDFWEKIQMTIRMIRSVMIYEG